MIGSGTRLGAYDIVALIGAGGMGEVYRARDTKLKREVALKVLPVDVASDRDRLARFQREAEVLASLNHPNVAQIYGLEESNATTALVIELVEGATLAERIARGPMPFDEALPIAKQIAEALEAAHEQGIIHRDLKPANIKVRDDGTVKVLDFGLAKLSRADGAGGAGAALGAGLSQSPTITSPALVTGAGVILGTAAYMAPEQAKGREADRRSDIWALGAVLYEMLTGRRAFDGEDVADVLGAVVRLEPDWAALRADVPPAVQALMRRCLVKDRGHRIGDVAVVKFVLAELGNLAGSQASPATARAVPHSIWRSARLAAAVAALTALVVGSGAWLLRPQPAQPVVTRLSIRLPEGQFFSGTSRPLVAVSPDGTHVAYVANDRIYLRSIGELEPREVPGSWTGQQVWNPMFAPDGGSIAFTESSTVSTPYTLKRIPVIGGTASTLATLPALPEDATWSDGGLLLVNDDEGILRVPAGGGMPERIVAVQGEEQIRSPQILPGGRALLFSVYTQAESGEGKSQIVVQSLADGERRVLIEEGYGAKYLPTGHLLYALAGTILAVPFNVEGLAVTGTAVPVVAGVRRRAVVHMAVSDTGTLAYIPGPASTTTTAFHLVVGDGRAAPTALRLPAAAYEHPRVSPDGRTLAVGRTDGLDSNIWTYDLSGNSPLRRLTFGKTDRFPVWSVDGRRVTFQSGPVGDKAIWWQPAGGGSAERLTTPTAGEEHVPEAWSPDGRQLLFSVTKGPRNFLWVLTLDGRKAEPVGDIQSAEPLSASFSPDGRWIAYAFNETRAGGASAPDRGTYVSAFPVTGERHQAPKLGGDSSPVWSRDGSRLYYVPTSSRPPVSVPITTSPAVAFGAPEELPRGPRTDLRSTDRRGYDVLRDGRILSVLPEFGEVTATSGGEIRVVINWFEELKRLVPAN